MWHATAVGEREHGQMATRGGSRASALRAGLTHPVVDADGHLVESLPAVVELMAKVADDHVAGRLLGSSPTYRSRQAPGLPGMDSADPHGHRPMMPWWTLPTDARDRATAFVPAMLHERLDEMGIDFAVLYPSVGLTVIGNGDPEVRRAACRAVNIYAAELTAGLGDRLAAVATIPCHTPQEALAELDYAVGTLGFKAAMFNSYVHRPPGEGAEHDWYDVLAMDSCYDYDPVWAACVELGVAVSVHTPTMGLPLRASPTRYMANHIGNFATGSDAFLKALVFGGVMQRFPSLEVAFLEGGVSFGVQLLGDLISRLEKRGGSAIRRLDPSLADFGAWDDLVSRYGGPTFADPTLRRATFGQSDNPPRELDDFADSGVASAKDLVEVFDRFHFGCEADDPTTSWAFATERNPGGAELHAMLGSDVGHWDVADMTEVLPEAYEVVEHQWLDADQFQRFVCDNVIALYGRANPAFFEGTRVQGHAREVLGRT